MHQLPNDTIAVTLPDFGQSMTVLGDPGLATDDWGGNDALTAAISSLNSNVTLVGEDAGGHAWQFSRRKRQSRGERGWRLG